MALALGEAAAQDIRTALDTDDDVLISAATVAETLIVAGRRGLGNNMAGLLEDLGFEVEPVTAATARGVARAYSQWGKAVHPAALNLGDCFAYALAKERDCPLLFVGNDFAATDIKSALS